MPAPINWEYGRPVPPPPPVYNPPQQSYAPSVAGAVDYFVNPLYQQMPRTDWQDYYAEIAYRHANPLPWRNQDDGQQVVYYGDGGGGYEYPQQYTPPPPPPITWSEKYTVEGAPEFWKGMMPSRFTPTAELAVFMNALVPFLSAEDQRQMASSLSRLFGDGFGGYDPEKATFGEPTSQLSEEQQRYFTSAQRANQVLSALDKVKEAAGKDAEDFGPGYKYLRNLAQTMQDFGGKEGFKSQTRREKLNMFSALDPLLSETKGEQLGAYGEVARALTQPFFSGDQLMDAGKREDGSWVFGKPNTEWY